MFQAEIHFYDYIYFRKNMKSKTKLRMHETEKKFKLPTSELEASNFANFKLK